MATPVPIDDLPRNLVPANDLPDTQSGLSNAEHLRNRFTNVGENIAKNAYKLGGFVTDVSAKLGASPEVAGGVGLAANVGAQAIPAVFGGSAFGNAVSPVLQQAGKGVMQAALKPPLGELQKGNAARAINTMLEEGINVTPGGVEKIRSQINDLNQQVVNAIKDSPATVNKYAVWKSVKSKLDDFTKQVNPASDIASIRAAWNEFLAHPMITSKDIPVQTAQELKQGTYRVLANKYGELKGADVEGQKAIARGLKEEIAKAVPSVGPLNAKESELINALNLTERRVLISANKNPGGISWLARNPAAWAAFMADKSELFKSLMARMIYSGSERIPQSVGGVGLAAIQSAQENNQNE